MVLRMTRPDEPDTPGYWATAASVRYMPAIDYVRRMRHQPDEARVSRCTSCGQWTWDGVCRLHPTERQEIY